MQIIKPIFIWMLVLIIASCNSNSNPPVTEVVENQEQHRPQFHFSPKEKWMNDPNGMVYYNGEYHLFFQHYPDSTVWGPMHWGHAVSKNMVDWEYLPIALYPDSLGMIFSGSAVLDQNNTSGLGKDGQAPLVAIFTYHDANGEKAQKIDYQTQGIAFSTDNGRTWTKYADNPVLKNPGIKDFRDPKVMWHEPTQKWIMALAVQDHIAFYSSPDLKNWALESEFGKNIGTHGGVWECPDLFQLPVEGSNESKWILFVSINPGGLQGGSATQYFIGSFDGKTFTLDDPKQATLWLDYGRDNYAGVTWSNIPKEDGRRLFLGWMGNWQYAQTVPTEKWRSAMTLPRVLTLHNTPVGHRLFSTPVKELETLRDQSFTLNDKTLEGSLDLTTQLGFSPTLMEAILEFDLSQAATADIGIELSNSKGERYRLGYDATKKQFYSNRLESGKKDFSEFFTDKIHVGPRNLNESTVKLHIFFDVASAELFADNGAMVMTDIFFPNEDYNKIKIYSEKGAAQLKSANFYALKSIWK
ncbi:MAG: glycoside hydrolase family 32 protein [Saprospiraceae bacterium]|nr:glycoside hydrolase family 32 protein [Saprospiraceae bacterium]